MSTALTPQKILCIGDFMLDLFIEGVVERISPEAPIPVLKEKNRFYTLGGAGNVVRNLASLGLNVVAIGVLDSHDAGKKILSFTKDLPNVNACFITEAHWTTPLKTRLSSNGQQLLRFDHEKNNTLSQTLETEIYELIDQHLPTASAVILSDYHKGTLSDTLCKAIIDKAKAHNVPVIVDPKGKDYKKYSGATLLTPNLGELKATTHKNLSSHESIVQAANDLRDRYDVSAVIVTMGADGMMVAQGDDHYIHIPSKAKDVFDVSGAGDTVIATLTYGLVQQLSLQEAAMLANKAGGIVVGKIGTAVIQKDELFDQKNDSEKIMNLSDILEQVKRWKSQNLTVGFTNGCFDLLHLGHLHLLRQCKNQCDRLILGLNTDASIQRLKGPTRPIQNQEVRSQILAALELVDAVILFDEDTPLALITSILPDVLIKGSDYSLENVVGAKEVIDNGGRVYLAELKDGFSTTSTVKKIALVG